jgi:isopropylmalate/homocitrate/citramalate synthase
LGFNQRKRVPQLRTNGVVGEELFSRLKGVHQQHVSTFWVHYFHSNNRKRIPHHRTNGVVGEELFSRLKGVHQQHVFIY